MLLSAKIYKRGQKQTVRIDKSAKKCLPNMLYAGAEGVTVTVVLGRKLTGFMLTRHMFFTRIVRISFAHKIYMQHMRITFLLGICA